MKTAELTGAALDWTVAKCEGKNGVLHDDGITRCIVIASESGVYKGIWKPSTNWAQGGPIIEREGISPIFCDGDLGEPQSYWVATIEKQCWEWGYGPYHDQDEKKSIRTGYKNELFKGPTPLIATMRCYVASKLGDNVEIPKELTP